MADDKVVDKLVKAIKGDPTSQLIKSGTLAITRVTNGAAAIVIATYAVMQAAGLAGWESIPAAERIWLAIATAALWAIGSAADGIARGIASTKPDGAGVLELPPGLKVTKTKGVDEQGWAAVAIRHADSADPTALQWLIVKGADVEWVAPDEISWDSASDLVLEA
ncbi:MAG: hypothetical protein U5R31_16830 [Acidimicrobiia bacterium]|nr:hypothetical protein [Acidimicrobiia bacterium]